MERIKGIFIKYKLVIQNFSYLSLLQMFNVLLPLLTYPYLIRVLGSELYGTVIFAQAIVMYFSMFINFGFNVSATKDVAEHRADTDKLIEITSAVYLLKFVFWFLSLIVVLGLIATVSFFYENWLLVLFTFGFTFSDLFFPQYYFQGVEKMKYITIISGIAKVLFTALIFVFVKNSTDYLLVPLFQGVGAIISCALAIYVMTLKEGVFFRFQKIDVLKYYFRESLPLFISDASTQLYVNANKVIIGSFLGMNEVAFYDLSEKVLRLLKLPIKMLGQATFPSFAREKIVLKINAVMKLCVLATFCLVFLVFMFSVDIVYVLGGTGMEPAIHIMRILASSAVLIAVSQFLGTSRLVVFGFKKEFMQIIASSGGIFFIGVLFLYLLKGITITTLAWLAVGVELWGALMFFIVNYRKKLLT